MGEVESGKTTLVGVLTSPDGVADNGHGSIRDRFFNFTHEKKAGTSSSIGNEIIGFTSEGV